MHHKGHGRGFHTITSHDPRVILRKAGPHDSGFAYCTRRAAFKQYIELAGAWREDEQRRLHKRRSGAQDFRVISFCGIDVGIMAVIVAADCLKVNQLLLLPEHQGQDIGRRSMLLIMEEARDLGLPVRLRVMKVNPRALAFYERLGSMRIGETDSHYLMEAGS